MNISPGKLQDWLFENRRINVIDTRPEDQRKKVPLINLDTTEIPEVELKSIKFEKFPSVLICQFGIKTKRWIEEHDLENTYNLIGGALAWNEYQRTKMDLSRYSRQMALPEIGKMGQKKLLQSKVAIVGMGGLGCPVAQYLVAAGVGYLRLIDGDLVDITNLQRQPMYTTNDINKPKVEVAYHILATLNPGVEIEQKKTFLTEENIGELLSGVDVIVDATDSIPTRHLIDQFSKRNKIPMIYGGLYRFEGQVSVFNHDNGPSYSDLYPPGSAGGLSCGDEGVLGMLPGIIGNIQALETIKILLNIKPNLSGRLFLYDGITQQTELIDLMPDGSDHD